VDDEREYEEEFVRRRSLEDEARERERERAREGTPLLLRERARMLVMITLV
jgi:hypothetical protein